MRGLSDSSGSSWTPSSSPSPSPPDPESRVVTSMAIDIVPTPHQGHRREVDGAFVQFLIEYAAHDTECPPLFKAFLEDVVLKHDVEELPRKVEYYLRNPDIKSYNLGPTFLHELEKYTIYDQLYPASGPEAGLPSAPIPDHYLVALRNAYSMLEEARRLYDLWDTDEESEDEEDMESSAAVREAADHERRRSSHRTGGARLASRWSSFATVGSGRSRSTAAISRVAEDASEVDGGALAELLRRLQSIRPLPQDEDVVGSDELLDRTGRDWEADSWYKDRRQPPLALRLDTIVRFLAEEDVDRCMHWEVKLADIVAYLEWLAHDDDRHQLRNASAQAQALFNDAITKAKTHALFEKHHYGPTSLDLTRPSSVPPLRSTRLNWMVDGHEWPIPDRNPVPDRSNLLPRSIGPRPSSPVNRMLIDNPDGRRHFDKFADDEKEWWERIDGVENNGDSISAGATNASERNNLAYIEDHFFSSFAHGDQTGWIIQDLVTGQTTLPDGTALSRGTRSPRDWAKERGARRAGLQQMTRALPTDTPPELTTRWRTLVMPTPAAALRTAYERVDGPQWAPPRLDDTTQKQRQSGNDSNNQLDPMAHTVAYRARLAEIKRTRELARLRVEDKHGRSRWWVALPRNLVNGGPFGWEKMTDPDSHVLWDLMRQCQFAIKVLRAALEREPRPLLQAVISMAEGTAKGEVSWGDNQAPEGVRLAENEWVSSGQGRTPRRVDAEEIEWLKSLAGGCVNGKNWTGRFVPDTPRDKYRLFLLFAARVQRLLDDRNPQGLFSRHDAEVTVEELLQAINAGSGSSAVTKCEFQPHDACCWLDRLRESGHVRFRLDPACYGVVQRPEAEYFPEHRVLWPTAADNRERPSLLGYVADWSSVIQQGHKPDTSEGSNIGNFFLSLAFRLGYTIWELHGYYSHGPPRARQKDFTRLLSSITKWERTCDRLQRKANPEPSREELAVIRSQVIAEASANETMLAPARTRRFFDAEGNAHTTLVRDHNWDWAAAAPTPKQHQHQHQRRRHHRHQFWSVDRWPVGTGRLSEAAERAVAADAHLDPRATQACDPFAADPTTDPRYTRPKLRPYRHEKVLFRPGPALYPVGDTRLQREAVEARMTDMVARAIGLDLEESTWGETLARLNPFSRSSSRADDRDEDGKLPPVDLKAVPRSKAPSRITEEMQIVEGLSDAEWAGEAVEEVEDGLQSVDVAMTGMGAPWFDDSLI